MKGHVTYIGEVKLVGNLEGEITSNTKMYLSGQYYRPER
jgi:hypothetical protein